MDMALLQLYKNKYNYPKYSASLTAYGSTLNCTPVGFNLRSGKVRVEGSFSDFMSCNYLALTRDGRTIYAWIDDVSFLNDRVFEIGYTVDAWRTYKGSIDLGTQFIKRSTIATNLKDTLLGSTQGYWDIDSKLYEVGNTNKRVMVAQVRGTTDSLFSNVPVQPTPYMFYLVEFDINDWQSCKPLSDLMALLVDNAEVENLVTMYSIPYMNISGVPAQDLVLKTASATLSPITGFKCLDGSTDASGLLYVETPLTIPSKTLLRVDHSVQVVIPEAGILNIPDEILFADKQIFLRQDVDLFSGASNYMLVTTDDYGLGKKYYTQSVRGASVSSIPIINNPEETYMSQNQNALITSMIGDVASVALGVGTMGMGGGLARFLGGGGDAISRQIGAGIAVSGGTGLMNTWAGIQDAGNSPHNPPAFLGTALAANFNQKFWVVTRQMEVTNSDKVHGNYGYPYNMVDDLSFPDAGYIETQSCHVSSKDGSVPRWALNDINTLFDNGILVI